MLYEQDKKECYGFNDDFFVVSDAKPIADSNIYLRRTKLATLAGLKVIRIHDFMNIIFRIIYFDFFSNIKIDLL